VGAAIYLEEYAPQNRWTRLIELNIANLAGIPSIIYGLLGLEIFVRTLHLERSLLAGSLTMALLVLPIIIISAREAIRAVPRSIREAAYALGTTKWQMVKDHVLPLSLQGILTGVILAVSRAIGETAPLITIGALTYVAFLPSSPFSPFTVLPIQIFNWVSRPQEAFHGLAAAGILLLLAVTLSLNAVAILMRNYYQKRSSAKSF
jgi:phosphate transport system permease protein